MPVSACGVPCLEMDHASSNEKSVPDYCQVMRFKDASGNYKELIFPKALDLDRPKRPRTTFNNDQLGALEREFQRNQYLIGRDRTKLASELGLSETQIKVWFQNRRTKCKREKEVCTEKEVSPLPTAERAMGNYSPTNDCKKPVSNQTLLAPVTEQLQGGWPTSLPASYPSFLNFSPWFGATGLSFASAYPSI